MNSQEKRKSLEAVPVPPAFEASSHSDGRVEEAVVIAIAFDSWCNNIAGIWDAAQTCLCKICVLKSKSFCIGSTAA